MTGLYCGIEWGPIGLIVGAIYALPSQIIHGIKFGFSTQKEVLKEVLNLDKNTKGLNNNFKTKMNNDDIDKELLNESLKICIFQR